MKDEITRGAMVKKLIELGYDAIEETVEKNGLKYDAIIIRPEAKTNVTVSPIFYSDELIGIAKEKGYGLNEIVRFVCDKFEEHKNPKFDFNAIVNDRQYVLDHLYMGLIQTGYVTDNMIAKDISEYPDLSKYLFIKDYMKGGDSFTIKANNEILLNVGIGIDEAWIRAEQNTFADTKVVPLSSMFSDFYDGLDVDNIMQMYVFTNSKDSNGAAAVLNRKMVRTLAQALNVEQFFMIPSSIHECILVPLVKGVSGTLADISRMVKQVNESSVDPIDRLSDHAYILTV